LRREKASPRLRATSRGSRARRRRQKVDRFSSRRNAVREIGKLEGGASAGSPLVVALQQDLSELQAAARQNDRRTVDELAALHKTLDRVVDRLTTLEAEARGTPTAAKAAPQAPIDRGLADEDRSPPVSSYASRALEAGIGTAGDRPLKPGSGRPEILATGGGDHDRKADFIAAARRAAQAAAAEQASMSGRRGSEEGQRRDRCPLGALREQSPPPVVLAIAGGADHAVIR
jgi:localization factor PodJL